MPPPFGVPPFFPFGPSRAGGGNPVGRLRSFGVGSSRVGPGSVQLVGGVKSYGVGASRVGPGLVQLVGSLRSFGVGSSRVGPGSTSGFYPTDLGANLLALWDNTDVTKLFADSARTTLAANGVAANGIADKSGNGCHLSSSLGWVRTDNWNNGKTALVSSGSRQYQAAFNPIAGKSAWNIWFVFWSDVALSSTAYSTWGVQFTTGGTYNYTQPGFWYSFHTTTNYASCFENKMALTSTEFQTPAAYLEKHDMGLSPPEIFWEINGASRSTTTTVNNNTTGPMVNNPFFVMSAGSTQFARGSWAAMAITNDLSGTDKSNMTTWLRSVSGT